MFKKKSSKFRVCSSYKSIDFEFQNSFSPDNINVKWCRHKRYTDSLKYGDPPIWNKSGEGDNGYIAGRCNFKNQIDPEMQVTLHKGKKTQFKTKVYRYTIESVSENGNAVTLANADIDFTIYADNDGSTQYLAIEMKPKQKFVLNATLNLRLTFEFIKTADSKDADMVSTFSKDSGSNGYSVSELDSEMTIENKFSLAHQIQHYRDDVISPGANSTDVFKFLTNSKLIILVFDGRWIEKSSKIVQALNSFYSQIKMHFSTSVEIFYVSMDKDENALLETIQGSCLKCPAIKPQSQLSSSITQHYEITKAPYMLVLTDSRIVTEMSGDVEIINALDWKEVNKVYEKWASAFSQIERTFSLDSLSVQHVPRTASKVKDRTSEILKGRDDIIYHLESEKILLSNSNNELEDEVIKLNDKLVRQTSLIDQQVKKERKLTQESKLLEAERDIRGTMMKRGVRGMTGHFWRPRFFQYEDQKIIYIDPKTNETKGYISVQDIISIGSLPNPQQDKNNASFSITVPGRVYEMQARDHFHMQSWISAVRYLMEQPKKSMSVCGVVVEEKDD